MLSLTQRLGSKIFRKMVAPPLSTMILSPASPSLRPQREDQCKNSWLRARLTDGHPSETKRSIGRTSDASRMERLSALMELTLDITFRMVRAIDTASTWFASQETLFE